MCRSHIPGWRGRAIQGRWETTEKMEEVDGTSVQSPKPTSWELRFGGVLSSLWMIKADYHISHQDLLWKLYYRLWSSLNLEFFGYKKDFSCCHRSVSNFAANLDILSSLDRLVLLKGVKTYIRQQRWRPSRHNVLDCTEGFCSWSNSCYFSTSLKP